MAEKDQEGVMLMPVKSPDFHYVSPEHKAIDARLENWASYVRVKVPNWVSPIWKLGKSNGRQWHQPEYRPACDTLDGHAIEKAVSVLPDLQRDVIRWAYVHRYSEQQARKSFGLTKDGLFQVLQEGRSMLKNRGV